MPVQVNIPTRIRIDREAAEAHGADIASAVQAAIRRALEASRTTVLEKRGGYLPAFLAAPKFKWSGEDLERLPKATRRRVEDEVARAIEAAAKASGVLDSGDGQDIAQPLSEAPVERFDAGRYDNLFQQYEIPSYDGGRKKVQTQPKKPPQPIHEPGHEWRVLKPGQIQSDLGSILKSLVAQWGPQAGTQVAAIAQVGGDARTQWVVVVMVKGKRPMYIQFGTFGDYEYVRGQDPPFATRAGIPAAEIGMLSRTRLDIPGESGLLTYIQQFMTNEIKTKVMTARPKGPRETVVEYETGVEAAVVSELDRRVKEVLASAGPGKTITSVVRVSMGAYNAYLAVPDDIDATLPWEGDAVLLPVSTETAGGGDEGEGDGGGDGGDAGTGKSGGKGPGKGSGKGKGGGKGSGKGENGGDAILYSGDDEPPVEQGSLFPPGEEGGITLTCQPWDGEPLMTELGSDGNELIAMMKDIARRLSIPECMYASHFCLNAAIAIGGRCGDISRLIGKEDQAGFTKPTESKKGNLGAVEFVPTTSPSIRYMRHLAGLVPSVARMMRRTRQIYALPAHRSKVKTEWGSLESWHLHFMYEFSPAMDESVGYLFMTTCQAMLLQLLLASKDGIEKRIANFKDYAPIFERLLVTQLSDYTELTKLRDRLKQHAYQKLLSGVNDNLSPVLALAGPGGDWATASKSLASAFVAIDQGRFSSGQAMEVVTVKDVERVRDSHGVLWSMEEIERALVTQRGSAESIDPLVKQITDLPLLMDLFRRDSSAIKDVLKSVLDQMQANNTEMLGKVRNSAYYAFQASTIQENTREASIQGTSYVFGGIHDLAHQQIGEFFLGDVYYATGVDALFSAELGRKELIQALTMIEIVILSVLCPPIGFLAGVQQSAKDLERAHERERMFGALLDPELVLTRAEVEMELFAARLGMALSLIPEAGTLVGAAARGGKVALRAGIKMGGAAAARFIGRKIAKQVIAAAARDVLEQFVKEILTNVVMDKVIQKVLEPVLAHVEREAQMTETVGGRAGARIILAILDNEKKAAAP